MNIDVKRALEVINSLERQGIIQRYAIGGAMAAVFYAEPVSTFDLDIFIAISPTASGLTSRSPLYEVLAALGYRESGECIDIEGIPVQFLPAYNSLIEEALAEAVKFDYDSVSTRVFSVEHLIAIALQTGRPKDRARLAMLRNHARIDFARLERILLRSGLMDTWKLWLR